MDNLPWAHEGGREMAFAPFYDAVRNRLGAAKLNNHHFREWSVTNLHFCFCTLQ